MGRDFIPLPKKHIKKEDKLVDESTKDQNIIEEYNTPNIDKVSENLNNVSSIQLNTLDPLSAHIKDGFENLNCPQCKKSQWRFLGNYKDKHEEEEFIVSANIKEKSDTENNYCINERHPIKKVILYCLNCGYIIHGSMRTSIIEELFVVKTDGKEA